MLFVPSSIKVYGHKCTLPSNEEPDGESFSWICIVDILISMCNQWELPVSSEYCVSASSLYSDWAEASVRVIKEKSYLY